jgi:hypothetical protein
MRHALERLSERYGIHRNQRGVVAALKAMVMNGDAKFRKPLPHNRSEWQAYIARRRVRFVWDEETRTIITVLPPRGPRGRRAAERVEG